MSLKADFTFNKDEIKRIINKHIEETYKMRINEHRITYYSKEMGGREHLVGDLIIRASYDDNK